jgi:transcriptional regulator of acetoin/glycerol metabolism
MFSLALSFLSVREKSLKLRTYAWPGNIRELANVCTYIAALSGDDSDTITLDDLPLAMLNTSLQAADIQPSMAASDALSSSRSIKISRDSLAAAMENFAGHREFIAKYFGISRMTLWRKMKKFDLEEK